MLHSWFVMLLCSVWASSPVPQPNNADRATPQATVAAMRNALLAHDFLALSQILSGPDDAILRALAEPHARALAAARQLDEAVQNQPNLTFTNPFNAGLTPFAGITLELVEVTQEDKRPVVRIRFARPSETSREEVLGLVSDGSQWRISLPAELRKVVRRLGTPETELRRQAARLEALAQVLEKLAVEVREQKLTTTDAIVVRLAQLIHDSPLKSNSADTQKP